MNKKGFTLVELLAVIVILALLALLTSTAVTKLVSDAKNDLSNTQIELIESAAKTWGAENLMRLPTTGECSYLTLEDLKNYGLLDDTILDPKTNQEISDTLKIKITTTLSKYGNSVTNYELNPESISGCEKIYKELYGDINIDGVVDEIDEDYLDKYIKGSISLSNYQISLSDLNKDEEINELDLSILIDYNDGLITSLPTT